MQFETDLHRKLYNDTGVQSAVSNYEYQSSTYYMIFYSRLIPVTINTTAGNYTPTLEDKTINYYRLDPVRGGIRPHFLNYSASCRAYTQYDAETIQDAVFTALNRKRHNKSFFVCRKLAIIPPADQADNYNAPVEIMIKSI